MNIQQEQERKWAAKKFWLDLYKIGLRLTYSNGEIQMSTCEWTPRLRVEECGFGNFPVSDGFYTDERSHKAIVAGINEHAQYLLDFCSVDVPKSVRGRFCHLLSKDYEFPELRRDCLALGFDVYGLPLDGGIFPVKVEVKKLPTFEYKPAEMPSILSDYLEGQRVIANNLN